MSAIPQSLILANLSPKSSEPRKATVASPGLVSMTVQLKPLPLGGSLRLCIAEIFHFRRSSASKPKPLILLYTSRLCFSMGVLSCSLFLLMRSILSTTSPKLSLSPLPLALLLLSIPSRSMYAIWEKASISFSEYATPAHPLCSASSRNAVPLSSA